MGAFALLASLVWPVGGARAEPQAPAEQRSAPTPQGGAPDKVRVAMSQAAAEKMVEPRLRRLLELELPRSVSLAPGASGPLDEPSMRVWIDLAGPTVVLVQVQAPGRRVEARRVDVAGLSWDVAARFVALAASESVRGQLTPAIRKRPRPPSPDELLAAEAARSSVQTGASLFAAYLGGADTALIGSRLELAFHRAPLGQHVAVAALASTSGGHWIELSTGATHRLWATPGLRFEIGGGLGLAATEGLRGATDDEASAYAKASARLGLEARLAGPSWLSARLEPGVVLDAERGRAAALVGGSLAISIDAPTSSAPPRSSTTAAASR